MELSEYKNQLWKVSLRGLRGLARLLLRLEMGQKKSVPESQEGKCGCRAGMEEALCCTSRPQFPSVPVA